jgi:hypothetical protein
VPRRQPPPRDSSAARPDDRLVLAAVDRAAIHRGGAPFAAPLWAILAHLALARRSAAARHVRLRLGALADAGELASARSHGVILWALTRQGQDSLRRARESGELPPLPESPQHRAWRSARSAASEEIGRFRRGLQELLDTTAALLADPSTGSDAWLERGEQLRRACRVLASATHCLHEWEEPEDAVADIDRRADPPAFRAPAGETELDARALARRRALRAGRRNIRLWREQGEG